jgi:pimeloyl-ACP methyl ester carboxylesterase
MRGGLLTQTRTGGDTRIEVETLPRAGHACSMEQPAAFADSVVRFARRTFESL